MQNEAACMALVGICGSSCTGIVTLQAQSTGAQAYALVAPTFIDEGVPHLPR